VVQAMHVLLSHDGMAAMLGKNGRARVEAK
jgi:hypothetical protein